LRFYRSQNYIGTGGTNDIGSVGHLIVVGGIAGLLADAFVKGLRVGLVGTVIGGILGAIIAGWLFSQLGITRQHS